MKLLQKTTRTYLIFSALLIVLTWMLLYALTTYLIREDLSEKMMDVKRRIVQQLEQEISIPSLPPVMEIMPLEKRISDTVWIHRISLFDSVEKEDEYFMELQAIETIAGVSYSITLRESIMEPADYLSTLGLSLALVMLLLLIGLLILNRFIAKSIWSSFYRNLETVKNFSVEKEDPLVLEKTPIKEFKELNRAIEKLTEKVRSDFRSLKVFTENASHEMQTPLAIIQTKLEELLQSSNLTDEQARYIGIANAALLRLTRLNADLLLLAKIENRQFLPIAKVDIGPLIDKLLTQMEDFVRAKHIDVKKSIVPGVEVLAHPVLLETLLSNLLSNAIRHNLDEGQLNIHLTDESLEIANTGRTLKDDPDRLFGRFIKGQEGSVSPGLGLAIVRSICDSLGWQVAYTSNNEWHILTIHFKRAAAVKNN